MTLRIWTVPFNPHLEIFQDEELSRFLLNKTVKQLRAEFFQQNGKAFWTVFVYYENAIESTREDSALNDADRLLLQRLKEWRKEKAETEGVPSYILARNSELLEMVRQKPLTLEALRQIRGFGSKKVKRYGEELTNIIRVFYEKQTAPEEERPGPEEA